MLEIDFKEPTLEILEFVNTKNTKGIEEFCVKNCNLIIYKQLVEKRVLKYSQEIYDKITEKANQKLKEFDSCEELDKEKNIKEKCEFYAKSMEMDLFEKSIKELYEIDAGSNIKVDVLLCKIRINIILGDRTELIKNINLCKNMCDVSAVDWDRKNRFKIYLGLYSLMKTDFKEAAELFSNGLASFESEELLSLERCVLYLVFSAMLTFNRNELEKKVLINSDVMKFNYCELAESIHKCDYKKLFINLLKFIEMFENDIFLGPFKEYFCKEIKICGYKQFLLSYQSVHIEKMAEAFNVGVEHLEEDLRNFIMEGKITCVIDKVDGVITINGKKSSYKTEPEIGDNIIRNIRRVIGN